MKSDRDPGPTRVTSVLLRGAETKGVRELARVFSEVYENAEKLETRKRAALYLSIKRKGMRYCVESTEE